MPSVIWERRKCPPEFQERLTRMFGKNQFGDPRFKIVWGQSQFIRMGNQWIDKIGNKRIGYRQRFQVHGMPCWVIMRWQPPIKYGSPAMYYANTYMAAARHELDGMSFDSAEGFYATGEYPWRGRYEIIQPLISKEIVDKKLVVTHFPLSHYLIDTLIPMMIAFERLSRIEQKLAKEVTKAAEEKAITESIADHMEENMPRWLGPVSYGGQGIRTSLLDRKMQQIQKVWDNMSRRGLRPVFNKGMAQGDRPPVGGYKR